ncbi:conserved Plasmodium protein, unknown function [Plasmodium sp. gorilla clade G2]|uniref:conserved Plasmodium protein, unknown function n=1 Tax=Plasmodium sp. gorilla clade G2 TaxID=880535 RepID=UPI000D2132F6|nr:conserved Plasmodium protein, unknown function [Plasmodium sp. gorilla clade G2]SOV11469.1 conserved Plasmodium protein, unknown function [Plasmodium sp. gorilla clade G2]
MSEIKSSSRYSSKKSLSYEKELSSTISQINKNRDDIIKNKVYCPIELKNVYTLLEESDKILRKKDSDINNLFKYNDKICELINICEHYKIHMNSQQKPELKKTYNSIEHNIQYLCKHIETAKKDNILLKKKLKKSTDPLFLSTLEQKNKQLCMDIENRKKEIKFLKESIRKNEKLLDSNKKKPNPVSLEKEYRNLLNQQSNLCSRLIQLKNGSKLYEESIQRIDDQLEEIKKKMNDLNLEKKNEKENLIEGVSDMSKENLEKKIFLLNTKRDELKKEKNNIINNLNNSLLKLKKQISVLENEKINLLNEEKSHIEKSQILKRTLNTRINKMNKNENKIKPYVIKKKDINKKELIEQYKEDNTLKEDNIKEQVYYVKDIKENNDIQHIYKNDKYMYQQNVQTYDHNIITQPSNFIESLLEDQTPEYKKDISPIIKTQKDLIKPFEENGNKNVDDDINNENNIIKYNTKKNKNKNKNKNNSNVFLPQFEEDILLKLQKTVNMKLNENKENDEYTIREDIKEAEKEKIDVDVIEDVVKEKIDVGVIEEVVKEKIDVDVVEEVVKEKIDVDVIEEVIKEVVKDESDDDVIEDMNDDVIEDMNDDVVEDMNDDVIEDMNDDVIKDMNDDVVEDMNDDVIEDMNDDVVEDMNDDVIEDMNDDVVKEDIKEVQQDEVNDDMVEEEIDEIDEHENKINELKINKEIIKEEGILEDIIKDDIINNDEIKMNDNIEDEYLENDKIDNLTLRHDEKNETYINDIQQYKSSYNITKEEQTFKKEDIIENMNNNYNFKEINELNKDIKKEENIILPVIENNIITNNQIETLIQNKEEEINEDTEKETLNF